MKGLILKDLLNAKRNGKSILFVMLLFVVVSMSNNDAGYLAGITVMVFTMLSVSTFSYDMIAKWDAYALTLPVTRKQVVGAKYIVAILADLGGLLLSIILGGGIALSRGNSDLTQLAVTGAASFFVALLFVSIIIPLIYRFGVEKSRFLMLAVMIVPILAVTLLGQFGVQFPSLSDATIAIAFAAGIVLILAAAYLSFRISCGIFEKKEF